MGSEMCIRDRRISKDVSVYLKRGLDWVIATATAVQQKDRYESISKFSDDLKAILADQPVSVSRPKALTRLKKVTTQHVRKRIGSLSLVATLLMLVLAGLAGFAFLKWRESELVLSQVEANRASMESRQGVANDLIMQLVATGVDDLPDEIFDPELIPIYQDQADLIEKAGGPNTNEEKTVFGVLAVLHALANDFDRADALFERVADSRAANELQSVREKICQRFADAAEMDLMETENLPHDVERARKQVMLARCNLVLGKIKESKELLKQALMYFEENDPRGIDALVIRTSLINTHKQLGERAPYSFLLKETFNLFKDERAVLATERGKSEMLKIRKQFMSGQIPSIN